MQSYWPNMIDGELEAGTIAIGNPGGMVLYRGLAPEDAAIFADAYHMAELLNLAIGPLVYDHAASGSNTTLALLNDIRAMFDRHGLFPLAPAREPGEDETEA